MKFAKEIPGGKIMLALIFCFFISCGVNSPKHVAYNKPVEQILPFISPVSNDTVKKDTTIVLKEKTVIAPKNTIQSLEPITNQLEQQNRILSRIDDLSVNIVGNTAVINGQTKLIKDLNDSLKRVNNNFSELNQKYNEQKQQREIEDTTKRNALFVWNYLPFFAGSFTLIVGSIFYYIGRKSKHNNYQTLH